MRSKNTYWVILRADLKAIFRKIFCMYQHRVWTWYFQINRALGRKNFGYLFIYSEEVTNVNARNISDPNFYSSGYHNLHSYLHTYIHNYLFTYSNYPLWRSLGHSPEFWHAKSKFICLLFKIILLNVLFKNWTDIKMSYMAHHFYIVTRYITLTIF